MQTELSRRSLAFRLATQQMEYAHPSFKILDDSNPATIAFEIDGLTHLTTRAEFVATAITNYALTLAPIDEDSEVEVKTDLESNDIVVRVGWVSVVINPQTAMLVGEQGKHADLFAVAHAVQS